MSSSPSPRTLNAGGNANATSLVITLTSVIMTKAFENVAMLASSKDTRTVSWKHEIKACKEDTPVKILDTLDQLKNMAELDGLGYNFDINRCRNLPIPWPDISTLDPVVDADEITHLKHNQKGMTMMNSAFTLSQHMSKIKKSVDGQTEGKA